MATLTESSFQPIEFWLCHDRRGIVYLAPTRPKNLDLVDPPFWVVLKSEVLDLLDLAKIPSLPVGSAVNLTTGETIDVVPSPDESQDP